MNSATNDQGTKDHSSISHLVRGAAVSIFQFGLMFAFLAVVSLTLPAQTLTTLHSFAGAPDGSNPSSAVVLDQDGNAYGTTFSGGNSTTCNGGCGTVFKVTPDGTETVFSILPEGMTERIRISSSCRVPTGWGQLIGGANGEKLRRFGLGTVFAVTLTGREVGMAQLPRRRARLSPRIVGTRRPVRGHHGRGQSVQSKQALQR